MRLLGPFEVRVAGKPVGPFRSKKSRWLLALLALRADSEVERSWLAATLWPDSDDKRALSALRTTLKDVRRVLGPEAWRLSSASSRTLRFDLSEAKLDVSEFDRAVSAGNSRRAADLYGGPLLEGCTAEWIELERDRRGQEALAALEESAEGHLAEGDWLKAEAFARRALAASPYREPAFRLLVQALTSQGNNAAVEKEIARFRRVLRRELNEEPDTQTITLIQKTRSQKKRLELHQAQTTAPPPSKYDLPHPIGRLVGREESVRTVCAKIQLSRLVTLTGTGGIGKTRLAIEVAQRTRENFDWGACLVEFSAISDPETVPTVILSTLGIRDSSGMDPLQTAVEALARSDLLLILDNCEHLLEACSRTSARLLASAPRLRILATSREPLGIAGEMRYRVPPLGLDHEGGAAVELFNLRMEEAGAALDDDTDTRAKVANICKLLDGIPLAIEMAAAHTPATPLAAIAEKLANRFALLKSEDVAATPRQRSVESTIAWSYQLLNEHERRLLVRLSIFAGGWTVEAAESICSGAGIDRDTVSELLNNLFRKSLVERNSVELGDRYRLLDTVRQFAQRTTEPSSSKLPLAERHASHYWRFCEETEHGLFGADQRAVVQSFQAEIDNVMAAIAWCAEAAAKLRETDFELAASRAAGMLNMSGTCARYWHRSSFSLGATHALERSLAVAESLLASSGTDCRESHDVIRRARLRPLRWAGYIAEQHGDLDLAQSILEQALTESIELGDRFEEAANYYGLGLVRMTRRDFDSARIEYERSLEIGQQLNDCYLQNCAHVMLGYHAQSNGDFESAEFHFRLSHRIALEGGNEARSAASAIAISTMMFGRGLYDEARDFAVMGLNACQRTAFHVPAPTAILIACQISFQSGIYGQAATLLGCASKHFASSLRKNYHKLNDVGELAVRLTNALGSDQFQIAFRLGERTSIEEACTMAIEALS